MERISIERKFHAKIYLNSFKMLRLTSFIDFLVTAIRSHSCWFIADLISLNLFNLCLLNPWGDYGNNKFMLDVPIQNQKVLSSLDHKLCVAAISYFECINAVIKLLKLKNYIILWPNTLAIKFLRFNRQQPIKATFSC